MLSTPTLRLLAPTTSSLSSVSKLVCLPRSTTRPSLFFSPDSKSIPAFDATLGNVGALALRGLFNHGHPLASGSTAQQQRSLAGHRLSAAPAPSGVHLNSPAAAFDLQQHANCALLLGAAVPACLTLHVSGSLNSDFPGGVPCSRLSGLDSSGRALLSGVGGTGARAVVPTFTQRH